MIPSPNLDDRTYQEIVDEAIRLIPHYCPEWTNHNPTDPGITLIELFAWMSEMMIYRLNKVPDKVYLALLDLIGLSLVPPQSAKTLLTFSPVEGYDGEVLIKRGIQVSTIKSELTEPLVFEIEKDLFVKNIKLDSCISLNNGQITHNEVFDIAQSHKGFFLFSGNEQIERYIYISDPSIQFLSDNNIINISFKCANEIKTISDEIVNFLEWEYWNGKKWVSIECSRSIPGIRKQDNEIFFIGPVNIGEAEVNGIKGFYLRAVLLNIPERMKCFELHEAHIKLLFHGEGLNPDACISNTENMAFYIIDISKDFRPFVEAPKYNDAFYIASKECFSKEDSEVVIGFYLSDAVDIKKSDPNEELILRTEYWNGKNWIDIADTSIKGVMEPKGKWNYIDSTFAFTKNGEMKFKRPDDMKVYNVNGNENYWIRIRICAGNFGVGGQYKVDDNGKWSWEFNKTVNTPLLSQIKLKYSAAKKPPKELLSYYDYNYQSFSENVRKNFETEKDDISKIMYFKILDINVEKCPITYFGFDSKFVSDENRIFFRIDESLKVKSSKNTLFRSSLLDIKTAVKKRSITLIWEYWDGTNWKKLSVNDFTDCFHESGFVEFKCPEDLKQKKEFGKDLYWIRLIFESGSFEINPKILNINLNSIYAYNEQVFYNELLGSSNGTPSQEFTLLHGPLLPGIKIMVRENDIPPADERDLIKKEEGEDAVVLKKGSDEKEEIWICYHEVDNFYSSTSKTRHYYVDYQNNKIVFGDGIKGIIPPRLKNNIRVVKYRVGGGVKGNVGANTVVLLREKIPYITGVTNPYSAEGGSDLEDVERLKTRATHVFKNLNRAVTAEDYEWLATEASTSVAKAKCLSKCGKNGEVILIVIPQPDSNDFSLKKKLIPTSELLRRVKEYLDVRKLVGTRLRIEPPAYKNISITVKIVFKKGLNELQLLKERIELSIYRYLHPITGGQKGKGWDFGMMLTKNEVFNVIEKIDGIYYIEDINIINDDSTVEVEKLVLEEDELIFINKINIIEREYRL